MTLDWSAMDSRDPSKFDGGGWVEIGDFCQAFDLNEQDEMSDINRPKSMLNRKKKNREFFTQPSNLKPLNRRVEFVDIQEKAFLGQVKNLTEKSKLTVEMMTLSSVLGKADSSWRNVESC